MADSGSVMGNDLLSIIRSNAQLKQYYDQQVPVACPVDGTPLVLGPPSQPGVWYCPFDFWLYPDDYDPQIHSGM